MESIRTFDATVIAQIKAMSKVKHTAIFEIAQPIDKMFALFSPEGAKLWVPGWNYEKIMGTTDLHEHYVFLTKNHNHASTDAIWIVKKYKPESYIVQFYFKRLKEFDREVKKI